MITGILKLKRWPILELRYLGSKLMKPEKSNGVLKSMLQLQNLKLGHSDSVFHMLHVPFANHVVFCIFYEIKNLKKNVVKVRIRKF